MNSFSHIDEAGAIRMVDVTAKEPVLRCATAEGFLICQPTTIEALRKQALPKGDVLAVARVAGIQAAKNTAQWIPLCHPLRITCVSIDFSIGADRIRAECSVSASEKTGVEMEALTGVSGALLTLYDMCKAVDKQMTMEGIRVVEKTKS